MIPKIADRVFFKYLLLVLIISTTIIALITPVARLSHHIFISHNEGWMAYFSEFAISPKPLYQPLDSFILNNYPPLSFYVFGALGSLLGDTIFAGRVIALLGLLVTTVMISLIVKRFAGSNYLSITAGILFVGYMGLHHTDYVAMSDPQWLAHGLMMSGLALFLYKKENRLLFFCSMLIMLSAVLTKHNLLPIPAAITIWLYMKDKRRFYYWMIAGFLSATIALLIIYLAYGGNFFADIFLAPRTYHIGRMAKVGTWLIPATIYISAAFFLSMVSFKDRDIQLIILFLLISLEWGMFITGGGGVYYNSIFDFLISIFIAAFIAVDRLAKMLEKKMDIGSSGAVTLIVFAFLLPQLLITPSKLYFTKELLKNLDEIETRIEKDIAFVADYPEPVMCENLALCYWAGKKFSFDFYSTGAELKTGMMPIQMVADELDNKEFSLIQINNVKGTSYFLTEDVHDKIFKNYAPIRRSKESGVFLVASE